MLLTHHADLELVHAAFKPRHDFARVTCWRAAWGLHAEFIKDSQARLGSTGAWRRGRKKPRCPGLLLITSLLLKTKERKRGAGKGRVSSGSHKETAAALVLLCVLGLESPCHPGTVVTMSGHPSLQGSWGERHSLCSEVVLSC